MTKKIFRTTISVALVTLICSIAIIMGVLYPYFNQVQRSQLKSELQLASEAVETIGGDYLEKLDFERYRITWIEADGVVTFDSHANVATMENHGNREEIREALQSGTGSSRRYSKTLTEETIYEAVRMEDGSILRISINRETALALLLDMIQPFIVILLFAILLSGILAQWMAKKVVKPLNDLDLENPLDNNVYEEVSPLLHRIYAQQREISKQRTLLSQKQEEFDQLTGNMREAFVLLDAKDCVLSLNTAAIELFSVDTNYKNQNFLMIDRRQQMREAIRDVREKGTVSFVEQRNGKEYQFSLNCIDAGGESQGIVLLAFDVTEKVNAERNRREFTANVSHELKTPLQSIIGSAELLENGIVQEKDVPRFVTNIRKEASRLVELINDIIRLSQLDENVEIQKEEVSLFELAQEVVEELTSSAENKKVTLHVHGDTGVLIGVRSLLYEVIYNLCDNAIKYNQPGGSVEMQIVEEENQFIIRVTDTGIGIPIEHRDKIFERFYRVDKSHSKQSGGTGLGLSIVKHAVLNHGGEIFVESQEGKGTKIEVILNKSCNEGRKD